MLADKVAATVARRRMFEPGLRVGVGVSGGADSVCLLHLLHRLAPAWNLRLQVLHLDHGLRGRESRGDADFVAALAAGLGLPCHRSETRIRESGNLEQEAREARRAFFRGFLDTGRLDRVALGHTLSDQAETVLFRFLRGSGLAGLAGILPVNCGIVRPLLEVSRREVLEYLRENGIAWREDSTNLDRRFARNRIRHDLLPALERDWNPALAETLARLASLAGDEEDYWRVEVHRLASSRLRPEDGAVLCRTECLEGLPRAAARRLLRHAFALVKGDLRRLDFSHVEQVLELAAATSGDGRILLPGLDVMRSFGWLRLAPPEDYGRRVRNYRLTLEVPGKLRIPGSSRFLRLSLEEHGYNEGVSGLDWDRLPRPLAIRGWRPGDRYQPAGGAEEKIKTLFQRARIPLWERGTWPIITGGEDTILWVRDFGPASDFAASPDSRTLLRISQE